jgi:hypothetical protein
VNITRIAKVALTLLFSSACAFACSIVEVRMTALASEPALEFNAQRGGVPLPHVRIDLYLGSRAGSGGLIAYSMETQSDGNLVLADLPPSQYEAVLVTQDSSLSTAFRFPLRQPVVVENGTLSLSIQVLETTLQLSEPSVTVQSAKVDSTPDSESVPHQRAPAVTLTALRGVVFDPTGAVIPKATIGLSHLSQGRLESLSETASDNDGRFAIEAVQGRYILKFAMPGFNTAYVPVQLGPRGWGGINLTMKIGGCGNLVGYEEIRPYDESSE